MRVSIPEPLGEHVIYEREELIRNRKQLQQTITQLRSGLEEVFANLGTGEYTIIHYYLSFTQKETMIEHLGGGFDLSVPEGRTNFLRSCKRRFLATLDMIQAYEQQEQLTTLDLLITGYRDCIRHDIEAKNP